MNKTLVLQSVRSIIFRKDNQNNNMNFKQNSFYIHIVIYSGDSDYEIKQNPQLPTLS